MNMVHEFLCLHLPRVPCPRLFLQDIPYDFSSSDFGHISLQFCVICYGRITKYRHIF